MELFQELVFTLSFSLIVYALIVKLFSVSSSCDDGNSTVSIRVEEKIEKEWVVCDSDKHEVDFCACKVFDGSPERIGLVKSDEGDVVEHELWAVDEEDEIFDDDWQGIEATGLEKSFGAAVVFVDSKSGGGRVNLIDDEVKVQLYGLHRVAIEGSCFEPQPMALKVSARANWNSWKRLENLGREDAMEQYIALLSQHVPDWMGRHASDKQ